VGNLIEECVSKVQPSADGIDWQGFLELMTLLREPKYQKINQVVLNMLDEEWINPFINLPKTVLHFNQMEFIL
jgi:hypothetical protein